MTRRAKILIAIVVLLLLIVLAGLLWLLTRPAPVMPPAVNNNQPVVNTNTGGGLINDTNPSFNVNVGTNVNTPEVLPPATPVDDRTGLKNTAKSFAELFG